MVWPGPSSLAALIAPTMLMPVEPPRISPSSMHEVEQHRQHLLVGDLEPAVERRAFEIGGDAALADAFGDRVALGLQLAVRVIVVDRRAHRIGEIASCTSWIALLQRHRRRRRACRRCRPRRRRRRPCRRSAPRSRGRWSRYGRGGWRDCRTGWPRSRRSARCAADLLRQASRNSARSSSDWRRAPPARAAVRRRTAAACPSSPGSGSRA